VFQKLFRKILFCILFSSLIFNIFAQTKKYKNIIFDLFGVLVYIDKTEAYKKESPKCPTFDAEKIMSAPSWRSLELCEIKPEDLTNDNTLKKDHNKKTVAHYVTHSVDYIKPISMGMELFRQIKEKGYKIYILSNIPIDFLKNMQSKEFSSKLLSQNYPDILKESDGQIYSCNEHLAKPDVKIYLRLLKKFNLDPKESVFIDDTIKNIEGAEKAGILGVLCKKHQDAYKRLISLGILKEPSKKTCEKHN
jgi:putative hydrolase of the HAD superfamily